jgi:hypothetical protein
VSLKKYKSQGKDGEVTVNSKEENSYDFCLDYVQEVSLRTVKCYIIPDQCVPERKVSDIPFHL